MQYLGVDMNNISAELVRNITDSNGSAKDLSNKSAEFKKIVQPMEMNNLCVMELVDIFLMDHDLGWLLAVPESKLDGEEFLPKSLIC